MLISSAATYSVLYSKVQIISVCPRLSKYRYCVARESLVAVDLIELRATAMPLLHDVVLLALSYRTFFKVLLLT